MQRTLLILAAAAALAACAPLQDLTISPAPLAVDHIQVTKAGNPDPVLYLSGEDGFVVKSPGNVANTISEKDGIVTLSRVPK